MATDVRAAGPARRAAERRAPMERDGERALAGDSSSEVLAGAGGVRGADRAPGSVSELAGKPARGSAGGEEAAHEGAKGAKSTDAVVGKKSAGSADERSLYKKVPVVEGILVGLLVLEIVMIVFAYARQSGALERFLLWLGIAAGVIETTKRLAFVVGSAMSNWLHRNGFTDPARPPALESPAQMAKFQDQCWQFVVHLSMALTEAYIFASHGERNYYETTKYAWSPPLWEQTHDAVTVNIYYAQLAVWIYTAVICVWFEERRRDFLQMLGHHVVTIALVGISCFFEQYRGGLLVLYIHDASDIFVDTLKLTNYLKLEGRRGWFASEVTFLLMVGTWMYYRLYVFPMRIFYSSVFESHQYSIPGYPGGWWINLWPETVYLLFPELCFLVILQCLHVWWFFLMLRILYKLATASAREASREEYEGDSDDEAETSEEAKRQRRAKSALAAKRLAAEAKKTLSENGPMEEDDEPEEEDESPNGSQSEEGEREEHDGKSGSDSPTAGSNSPRRRRKE